VIRQAGRKRAPRREDGKLGEREEPPIPTSIKIWRDETGSRSRLDVVTTDRNGLLVSTVAPPTLHARGQLC